MTDVGVQAGKVSERRLADQGGGSTTSVLAPSVTIKSNSVTGATRTVVVTRPLKNGYYTFVATAADATTPFIAAVGTSPAFAYHKSKAIGSLSFLPVGSAAGACVCPEAPVAFGQASGQLVYHMTNQSVDIGSGATGFRPGK